MLDVKGLQLNFGGRGEGSAVLQQGNIVRV